MLKIKFNHWFVPLLVLLLVLIVALPILTYPMGRDQGMYAMIGKGIVQGQTPYRDVWDIKPPAVYYIYAFFISIIGATTTAVRAIDFVVVPLTALLLYRISLRIANPRAASLTILLFGAAYFNESFASLSQSDSMTALPATLIAWCIYRTGDYPRATRPALIGMLLAGMLSALLLWFKQYYLFLVIAFVLAHSLQRRKIPYNELGAFAFGGMLVGIGGLLYFASNGMLDEMLIIMQSTAHYTAQGYDANILNTMAHYFAFRLESWNILVPLAVMWPIAVIIRPSQHNGWRLVGFWFAGGLAFLLIQAKGFDTHWLPMLPPLALIAADVLDRLIQAVHKRLSWRRLPHLLYAIMGMVILVFPASTTWGRAWDYLTGTESQIAYYSKFQANDVKPDQSLQVVEYLQQRVLATDTLYVWGFRPEIYYMGDWRPATRFIAHFPLATPWYPQEWQQTNVDILWAAMPPYVLVMQSDYMPWVTDSNDDSNTMLQKYQALSDWLIYNYDYDTVIGDFIIWHRHS